MSGLENLIAATLLAAPSGTPEPPIATDEWPGMREALQQVAVEMEILDERERRYVFARHESYQSDLDMLRRRHEELSCAPKLWEADRFPQRETVNEMLSFNREFRKHLRSRQVVETDRGATYDFAFQEADRLYRIYDCVRDAQCDFYYVTVRRQALKKLRCMVGTESFESGQLPPVVPTWQFQVMK